LLLALRLERDARAAECLIESAPDGALRGPEPRLRALGNAGPDQLRLKFWRESCALGELFLRLADDLVLEFLEALTGLDVLFEKLLGDLDRLAARLGLLCLREQLLLAELPHLRQLWVDFLLKPDALFRAVALRLNGGLLHLVVAELLGENFLLALEGGLLRGGGLIGGLFLRVGGTRGSGGGRAGHDQSCNYPHINALRYVVSSEFGGN